MKEEKKPIKYNTSQKIEDRFLKYHTLWQDYKTNRNQTVRFLSKNGVKRNIIDYVRDSVDRFNEYFPKSPNKEEWQSNTFEPITRDKIIAILSRIVTTKVGLGMELKSKNLIDIDQAESRRQIFLDLLESANEKNDDEMRRVWEALAALEQGTCIGFEGWKKESREVEYVKEIDPETGERTSEKVDFDFFDDVYGKIVPINEWYPETIWTSDIKDIKRVFWVTPFKYQKFKDEFGKFKNAKAVKEKGYYTGLNDFNWGISQDVGDSEVEVIRYYDSVEDKMGIWANGIEIYWGPLPWNHKEIPFWLTIGEPIDGNFLFGKSVADKLMSMQDVNNALINAILDQLNLALKSPIFVDGQIDDFDDGYIEPSRIYTMEQGTTVQKGTLGAVDPTSFAFLNLIKRSIESSSISDQSQGISTGGRKTRYEVEVLQEGALTLAGLFVTLLENSLKRKYWLRMKNILQYYTMPSKIESGKEKFKFIVMDDRLLTNGKTGKKMIEIVGDEDDIMSMEELSGVAARAEGVEEFNALSARVEPVQITRDWLLDDRFDFEIRIVPFSSVRDTELERKRKDIQFYQLTSQDPGYNQEMNKKDLAKAFNKDPRIVRDQDEVQQEMQQQSPDALDGLPTLEDDLV